MEASTIVFSVSRDVTMLRRKSASSSPSLRTSLKGQFPAARIVNFSATPERADGQSWPAAWSTSYPIFRAIQERYVKRLKAVQLNPRTLRYVRREDDQEIEVSLDASAFVAAVARAHGHRSRSRAPLNTQLSHRI
jgi:hypothetical protein